MALPSVPMKRGGVLFRNGWRTGPNGNRLTQVHLEKRPLEEVVFKGSLTMGLGMRTEGMIQHFS